MANMLEGSLKRLKTDYVDYYWIHNDADVEKWTPQVILRFLVQRGIIAIPKSVHENRIVENIDIFDFELDSEDMATISSMDEERSLFNW